MHFFQNRDDFYGRFKSNINQKEQLAEQQLNKLISSNLHEISNGKEILDLESERGISFFVFQENELIFWTNSSIPLVSVNDFLKNNGLIFLKSGWFQYIKKEKPPYVYLSLITIKYEYSIQNANVNSILHPSFGIDENTEVEISQPQNHQIITDLSGNPLLSIRVISQEANAGKMFYFFFFLGLILVVYSLNSILNKRIKSKITAFFISIGFLFSFYSISVILEMPNWLYSQKLFSPVVFGQSSLLPSLGHFLFTSIVVFIVIIFLSNYRKLFGKNKLYGLILLMLVVSILNVVISHWFEGLIINSNINFDINYLLELDTFSYIGVFIIVALYTGMIILIKYVLSEPTTEKYSKTHLLSLFWVIALMVILTVHLMYKINWVLSSWIFVALLIFSLGKDNKTRFFQSVLLMVLVSSTITLGFIKFVNQKELLNQEFLIKKHAKEVDPVSEYLFLDIVKKVESDTFLLHNTSRYWEIKEEIDTYLGEKYFSGYWNKYSVYPFLCSNGDTLIIQPENTEADCFEFFTDKIKNESAIPYSNTDNIHFLYNNEGIGSYLGKIALKQNDTLYTNATLYVELIPKLLANKEGYPELLLNEKEIGTTINTNKYSYAKYKKGKLINSIGENNFDLRLQSNIHFNESGFAIQHVDEQHLLFYQSDKNTVVVLSSNHKTIFDYLTTYSYFFIFCSLFIFIVALVFKVEPFSWQITKPDFSTKIQTFLVFSTFFSFVLFGIGTTYFFKKQDETKNINNLKEKLQSVLEELNESFDETETFDGINPNYVSSFLIRYSNVFYSDINLYDLKGQLIATSRPEIIERGLTSIRINPQAFNSLITHQKSAFIHDESIGNLGYLSAYLPFRNTNNEVIAIINLPYFAKQNQLETELSQFFNALINIYALLFLISIVIAVVFANYISEPVRLIKEKIGALQFGKTNELIDWQSNDEIGGLVKEYNKKVLELESSAELLAKSERESAWREMAKQVAHEIKNPLTPMKLSIQHLARSVDDHQTDLPERIKRTAKTLTEQIDTLTGIANEFSNFAKMPKMNQRELDIVEVVENVVDLFKEEDVELLFVNNCSNSSRIFADKDQLNRIFSNLIKNAIQAIPENKKGIIKIELLSDSKNKIIKVTDNGSGISAEQQSKIFTPNFTTKSTGMGLGLAMVKNMVENLNGSISFTTDDSGTCFTIVLPSK